MGIVPGTVPTRYDYVLGGMGVIGTIVTVHRFSAVRPARIYEDLR
jgi:hypothetical protein